MLETEKHKYKTQELLNKDEAVRDYVQHLKKTNEALKSEVSGLQE